MIRPPRATVALVAVAAWLAAPAVAHADPAGPTDYRTSIVAIEPATDAIDLEVVGGDAFLRVEVDPGHDVVVLGYHGEPYLHIDAQGVVTRNRRSYATYYNEARYGTETVPDVVDNDADPEWERIGDGGAWAWHDHRAHWMEQEPPLGLERGDSLPPQYVPIVVDDTPVEVEVLITWVAGPSRLPAVVGAVFGLGLATLGVLLGPASTGLAMLLFGAGALLVGVGQYASLPTETDPRVAWWVLPAVGVVCVVAAIVTYGRSRFALLGLTAVAAAQVLVWALERRTGLTRAVLPTDLPAGLDRFVTAAALSGALVVLVATVTRLFAPTTE